jgi:hypothetical protein
MHLTCPALWLSILRLYHQFEYGMIPPRHVTRRDLSRILALDGKIRICLLLYSFMFLVLKQFLIDKNALSANASARKDVTGQLIMLSSSVQRVHSPPAAVATSQKGLVLE